MNSGIAPGPATRLFAQAVCIRGTVALPRDCDGRLLLAKVLKDLHRRGCPAVLGDDGVILVQGRTEGRGSVLAFVDGGRIGLGRRGAVPTLVYAFSTRSGLQLCAVLSVVAACLAWFALESPGLTVFGALAPLLWLYGANFVMTAIRVPAWLAQFSMCAPKMKPDER
jgi:hypothetical protein